MTKKRPTRPIRCWARIEHRHRVETLIAKRDSEGVFRFDIHLQGDHETVFLDM